MSACPEKKPYSIGLCGKSEMRLEGKAGQKTNLMLRSR